MTYLSIFIFALNMFVIILDYRRNVFNFATLLNIIAAGLFVSLYVKV
jgi:hypothetical protein